MPRYLADSSRPDSTASTRPQQGRESAAAGSSAFLPLAAMWTAMLAATLSGCGGNKPRDKGADSGPPADEPAVRILILDDPPLADAIRQTWKERGEGELVVAEKTSQQVLDSPRKVLDADLVVYPAPLIGELAERDMLQPLDDQTRQDPNLSLADYFPPVRLRVMSWNREVTAAALGAPQLMLLYRRDLLKKIDAEPPQTWAEYDALAKRLADAAAVGVDGDSWAGACEPGGQWLGATLLARGACYLGNSYDVSALWDYRPMTAQLDRPEFQRALTEMKAASGIDRSRATPQQCLAALLDGRCGMAVCWPTAQVQPAEDAAGPIGCAMLPGAGEVYQDEAWQPQPAGQPARRPLIASEGRLVSITREALRRDSAAHRLIWLTGKEWSDLIGPASDATMPCRISSKELSVWAGSALDNTALDQFAEALKPMSKRLRTITIVRIPGRRRYLAALNDAVAAALDGADPAEALKQASQQWDAITNELGLEKQRDALARSLDL